MVGGLGKRYRIYFPDGTVEYRTMLGDPKIEGDTVKFNGRKWVVVRAVKLMGEEVDYELRVEAIEA
jgi:hypothetical protein